jgi:hypothetical protein
MLKINTNTDPNMNHGCTRQVDELLARAGGALQLQTERVEPTCCTAGHQSAAGSIPHNNDHKLQAVLRRYRKNERSGSDFMIVGRSPVK